MELINFGIDQLKEKGVKLVFTYGDPSFYSKVGFGFGAKIGWCEEAVETASTIANSENRTN